jgi:hypothetical protein
MKDSLLSGFVSICKDGIKLLVIGKETTAKE